MANYPESFLDQIKNKVDIVDLISTYVHIQKRGRDYWGCCPFHNEKTPSFEIKSDLQFYKCFGCGKSGNIFSFMMEYEKMSFSDSVEFLAEKAGLEIPDQVFDKEYLERKSLLEKNYAINKEAAHFYFQNLLKPEGLTGLTYLKSRGLSWDTIQSFGMGYSTDFNSLPNYLKGVGYDFNSQLKAGVIGINENNNTPYDFFGTRIIIPIINIKDKVIGFTGRSLEKKPDFAKYKNTGSTLAFNKKDNLFGINLLKKNFHGKIGSVVLVEGHMDVISLYQAGIKNVVASMGTALTDEQCKILKSYANTVFVSYDGDSAGQDATLRSLDMLKSKGLDVKVVCLTNDLDPDDYVKKYGKEGYDKLLDEALPLIDFKLYKVKQKFTLDSYDSREKYAVDAINILSGLNELEGAVYVDEVSKISGINKDILINQVQNTTTKLNKNNEVKETIPEVNVVLEDALLKSARFVLASILYCKNYVNIMEIDKGFFVGESHVKIYEYIYDCIKTSTAPKISNVFDILENNAESGKIIDALENESVGNLANYYVECVKKLKKAYINRELFKLVNELKIETDEEKKVVLKEKILQLTKSPK